LEQLFINYLETIQQSISYYSILP